MSKHKGRISMAQALRASLVAPVLVGLSCASSRAGGPGAAFLKIPVSARAVSMGSGFPALAEGADSLTANPAGMARLGARELNLLYAPHLQTTSLGFLAYAHPFQAGSVGLSCLTLRAGSLDGRDASGKGTGDFTAQDRSVAVSFARAFRRSRKLPEGSLRLGASVKYVSSNISSYNASTYAGDLGAQILLRPGRLPISLGAAVRNLGPGMRFLDRTDPLPLNAGLAVAVPVSGMAVVAGGATRYVHDRKTRLGFGCEVTPFGAISLRGSYAMSRTQGEMSESLPSLAGGIGLRFKDHQLDYAFMPMGELGPTQRISLTIRFGRFERSVKKRPAPRSRKRKEPLMWHYWKGHREEEPRKGSSASLFLD